MTTTPAPHSAQPATPRLLPEPGATLPALGPTLQAAADRAIARLRASQPAIEWNPDTLARCTRLALASDFAIDVLVRQPDLLPALLADDGEAPITPPLLEAGDSVHWPAHLRRFRAAASMRLVWRDLADVDDIDATLAGATALAQTCLDLALAALEGDFARRYGVVRADDAPHAPVRLVVLAMGKLGGGELNFSSDIDLVYAYASEGTSDGPRPLAAADYFARLGQQLARLLDETTADGFSHRVDLRLRPFGNAGRVALSFAAMEQYFQREGRDWERYAWQKARPVAGDLDAGAAFLESLRPFIYRRYLDYGALDGLRAMKATIAAEVIRKEMADDIKRGPGGIREIEFLAQALQLIRGGPEPALRERRLLPALQALQLAGHLAPDVVAALTDDYRFLRHLENRLQMRRDAQVHALPLDTDERTRIAIALGFADWAALCVRLDAHRAHVTAEFEALLAPRRRHVVTGDIAAYWRALPDAGAPDVLADAGFDHPVDADSALRDFARSPGLRNLSDAARARLDRLMPVLLDASAASAHPLLALRRLLALLQNILRRASYLALLDEQPAALLRLVDVVTRSALLSERLAAHPLLLDELLDARGVDAEQSRAALHAACATAIARGDDSHLGDGAPGQRDIEVSLLALNETRQSLSFRTALAALDRTQPPTHSTRQLAWLADAVVESVLELATQDMVDAHGALPDARFVIVGYGSLGGSELGFGSDLDLVFLYDAPPDAASDGARALDAARWFARLAQKIVALLSTQSAGGRLYDTDVRLRPDGAKGLLVSSLASYTAYQRERAWTWEHQALVRARVVAGDAGLRATFEDIRTQVLARQRVADALHDEVVAMRARMRAELDRGDSARFDLKQGQGGLVDLEFLLQWLVLRHAAAEPRWLQSRDTPGLLDTAAGSGMLPAATIEALRDAHATLLAAALDCTLDRRQRIVARTPAIDAARAVITAAGASLGLAFA